MSTKIEWTDETWNPLTGCTKVSQGCKHCYAERDWARLQHLPAYAGRDFTDVATHADRLDQPLRWRRPRRIFVNSMSDLFHEAVPDDFIDRVFAAMALAKQHTFQVLTKRPRRMRDYMLRLSRSAKLLDIAARTLGYTLEFNGQYLVSWPLPNIWLGVSVEDQVTADERIPLLLETPAHVRFLSAEPLLGPVDLRFHIFSEPTGNFRTHAEKRQMELRKPADGGLHWVIVGGESGHGARPIHPNWARRLRDQCLSSDVAFLFKQWGEWAPRSGLLTGGETDFVALDPECKRWPHVTRLGEHGLDTREHCIPGAGEDIYMQRVGKQGAGRLLDGVLHNEYPEVRP